jgi:hypothetical protein
MVKGMPLAAKSDAAYAVVPLWDKYARPKNRSRVCHRPKVSW